MDLWDHVRDIDADTPLEQAQYDASRAALLAAIAGEADARRRRAVQGWVWGGGVGGLVVAGATVTALVIAAGAPTTVRPLPTETAAVTPTPSATVVPTPEPELTAAVVLGQAAALSWKSVAPAVPAGSYLRIDTTTEYLTTYGPPQNESSNYGVPRQVASAAWLLRSTYSTYVPADRSGEWVRVFPPVSAGEITQLFGTDAAAHAQAWMSNFGTEPIVERYPGGLGWPEDWGGPVFASDAYFAQFPRDPAALVQFQRDRLVGVPPEEIDEMIVQVLVQDLELNVAPADLRAAMFEALGLMDDVQIVAVEGDVTTIAFGFAAQQRSRTVSIDTVSGLVVASTDTQGSGSPVVPDSVPNHRTTTTFTVVDAAP